MDETEILVSCYWNGCIKYGHDGVYYEGSTPKNIIVKRKIALNRLLDEFSVLIGLDIVNQRSKIKIFGRYPSLVGQQSMLKYILLPVVNDTSLETMLEVPSKHPSVKHVDFYLKVKSDGVSLENPGGSSKRPRTCLLVKLEIDNRLNSNGRDEGEAEVDLANSVSDALVNLTGGNGNSHDDLSKDSNSGVPKAGLSSLWLDDHDLRVGLCFKDGDELKKTMDWCSIREQQKCVVRETGKTDEYLFECIRWKCKWSLEAVRMEKHGLFEIIKYIGPHTCLPVEPDIELEGSVFEGDEIERVVRVHPTQSFADLQNWWQENYCWKLEISEVRDAKEKAVRRIFVDWDQSFEDLPKLMSAFHSSNGVFVDWKYDMFPNPKFASFSGVFWAFPQSVEGFQHCRSLIVVDAKTLNDKYQLKLMIASGVDAANDSFPLAFAITKQVSIDSWRWFLSGIREKVTQRKGLCLISSPDPDILAAINEPGSKWQEPWAYHRFCLNHVCSQFRRIFQDYHFESLVMQAGSTSQKDEFDTRMETIKTKNPEARKWLDRFPPHQWALSYDGGHRYGMMKICTIDPFSFFEGFPLDDHVVTGSVLLLFDELRYIFDVSFNFCRAALKYGRVYTTPVMDKLEEFRKATHTYHVMPIDNNAFQVTSQSQTGDKWIVQLSECTCSCGEFQSCKFPCLHALAVCKKLKINPLQYVDNCYTFERYYKTFAATFSPVPEFSAWQEACGVPRLFPPAIPPSPTQPPVPKAPVKPLRSFAPITTKKKR